ncbi:prepilin-type N-terminal cleavage/methylation domain-containing protein [bacterium AH-315-J21]|nr:prepilin-type N-terminal cleavage/methylation domain-containing protein [bacterium AH-315-J21]
MNTEMAQRLRPALRRGKNQAGFTLVEALVTLLLTAIMGLLIVQALLFITTRSQNMLNQIHVSEQLNIIAQALQNDIASAKVVTVEKNARQHETVQITSQMSDTILYRLEEGTLYRNDFLLHDSQIRVDSLLVDTTESNVRGLASRSFAIYYVAKGEQHVSKHIAIKAN